MAKKTRKVMKQQSQQRAIQQAKANVSAADVAPASAPAAVVPAPIVTARTSKFEAEGTQEFAFVKSDVRRSLSLAGLFVVVMIALSFILH